MFDFEKLEIYKKSKTFNRAIQKVILSVNPDSTTKNQLRRASLSIVLNIAEGSGRNSKSDKRHFFVISRGSVFECVAILDILNDEQKLGKEQFGWLYFQAEELSKMLFAMIKSLE